MVAGIDGHSRVVSFIDWLEILAFKVSAVIRTTDYCTCLKFCFRNVRGSTLKSFYYYVYYLRL